MFNKLVKFISSVTFMMIKLTQSLKLLSLIFNIKIQKKIYLILT